MSEENDRNSKETPRATKGQRDPIIERAAKLLNEGALSGPSSNDSPKRSGEAMAEEARSSGEKYDGDTGKSQRREAPQTRSSGYVKINWARARRGHITKPGTSSSQMAEEFRQIKQSVLYHMFYGEGKIRKNANLLMITSALPNEGKTFVATNLAMSISSEKDLNVLLVDVDSINQGITHSLGITPKKGFFDLIDDPSLDFADVILRTDLEGLSILPAGKSHPMGVELLGSARACGLLDELASRYSDRIVIFDAPPVLATAASTVIAQHMGQIAFVVEADRTSRSVVEEAIELVNHEQNIAFILNKTRTFLRDTNFGAYYDSYEYGKHV